MCIDFKIYQLFSLVFFQQNYFEILKFQNNVTLKKIEIL